MFSQQQQRTAPPPPTRGMTRSERARANRVHILESEDDKYAATAGGGLECIVMQSSTTTTNPDTSKMCHQGEGASRREASNDFLCGPPALMNIFTGFGTEDCIPKNNHNNNAAASGATSAAVASSTTAGCRAFDIPIVEELKGMGIDDSSIIEEGNHSPGTSYQQAEKGRRFSKSGSAASSTERGSGVSHYRDNNNGNDNDGDSQSSPRAINWHFGKNRERGRKIPFWLLVTLAVAGVLLVVIIILVLVSRFLNTEKDEPKPQQPTQDIPSPRDYLALEDYILTLLPGYTLENIDLQELDDNEVAEPSPQTRAFHWLLNDPCVETYPDWRIVQRFALGTIFYSTGGNRTWHDETHWMSYELHENDWFWSLSFARKEFQHFPFDPVDFLRQDIYDEVIHLWLFNNSLSGTIPPEIGLLTHLKSIDLVGNQLGGSLPSQIHKLKNLMGLFLSANHLSSTIPTEAGNLHNLLWLSAFQNNLEGRIPSQIGMLPLWSLQLDENQLSGRIPSDLGRLSDILYLRLQDNVLMGSMPSEVGLMTALQMVDFSQNDLTGSLPSELGSFQMANLDLSYYLKIAKQSIVLDLKYVRSFNNALEEAVHKLNGNSLQLQNNRFIGTIPSELAQLSFNGQQHCVSYILGDNFKCNGVDLHNNLLYGSLPMLFSESLEYLDVSSNLLSGSIPEEISQWSSLRVLNASFNQLTGSIPIGSLHTLAAANQSIHLDVQVFGNSMLTGSVPSHLCALPYVNISFTCSELICGCSCRCRDENSP